MKLSSLIFTASVFTSTVTAFTAPLSTRKVLNRDAKISDTKLSVSTYGNNMMGGSGLINIADENAQRDVFTMDQWAMQYGVQKIPGVELFTNDGTDYQVMTQSPLPSGSSVVFVPPNMVLSSNAVAQEFGGTLEAAENALVAMDKGTAQRLPLFRLMVKILAEYDKGQDSPFFPWLNSMPRMFFNGVAMTGQYFLSFIILLWIIFSVLISFGNFFYVYSQITSIFLFLAVLNHFRRLFRVSSTLRQNAYCK